MLSHLRNPMILPALALVVLPATSSRAEIVGYTAENDTVTELLLSQVGEPIPEGPTWTFPGLSNVLGIERDSAGLLYVLDSLPISAVSLATIELEGEVVTPLQAIPVGYSDLAFDDAGVLWISAYSGDLLTYDPATDTLSPAVTITGGQLQGIAWSGGRLYVLFEATESEVGPVLGVADTATGTVSEARELEALANPDGYIHHMTSLDFDDDGGMWVGFVGGPGIADPPIQQGVVARFPNAASDQATIRYIADPYRSFMPLVVTGGTATVAVPATGEIGLALLAALLAGLALALLRRGPVA